MGRAEPFDSHQSTVRHITPGDATRKSGNPATQRPVAPGELTIAEDLPAKPKAARSGKAGFDPYSSDAGYSKPRGWDRVDRD